MTYDFDNCNECCHSGVCKHKEIYKTYQDKIKYTTDGIEDNKLFRCEVTVSCIYFEIGNR